MNPKTESVFSAWTKLNEDEKREFIKEVLSYNTLSASQKKSIDQKYLKFT